MGTEIEITEDHKPGLYDSDTRESLTAEKVVDISDDCRTNMERVVLLFTRAKRGRIVQVAYPYPGEAYMGAHIHFFYDEPTCDSFAHTAKRLGLTAAGFLRLIKKNAPQIVGVPQ